MSTVDGSIAQAYPRATAIGRYVAAIIVAGALASLAWMYILQEGHEGRVFGATWTQHDFPDGLGNAFGATDTARAGLFLTLGLGVVAAGVFALIERWLPGRGPMKGLWFAPLLFLAWGLVFTPFVDSRQVRVGVEDLYLPTGVFGVDAGGATILSGGAASLIAGIIIARIVSLMRGAQWWQAHRASELQAEVQQDLFELAEQGAKQGGERAG